MNPYDIIPRDAKSENVTASLLDLLVYLNLNAFRDSMISDFCNRMRRYR